MALTEKYVTRTAAGGGDGSSGTPWTWAEGLANLAAGMRLNINDDGTAYSIGTAQTIATAGPWIIQGYTTTAGDGGRPTLDFSTNAVDGVTISGAQGILRDIVIKSTATTGYNDGLRLTGSNILVERVTCYGWRETGLEIAAYAICVECEAYDCNKAGTALKGGFTIASQQGICIRCASHDINTSDTDGHGFFIGNAQAILIRCIADTCGGMGFFLGNRNSLCVLDHCDAYSCNQGGVVSNSNTYTPNTLAINCNSVSSSGGYGFQTVQAGSIMLIEDSWDYGNSSGRTSNAGAMVDESSSSTYGAAPYVDAANGDFTLHATNGAGGRNTARAQFEQSQGYSGSTLPKLDIGASRHADPVIACTPAHGTAAQNIYNGTQITSDGTALYTGTLNASNIATAAGAGSNLSADILKDDEVVDDVTGTYTGGAGGVILVEDD